MSEREKETLRLLLRGHDAKSAAAALGLSVHTINEYLREARRKLGVTSSREAARRLGDAERGDESFGDMNLGVAHRTPDVGSVAGRHPAGRPLGWLIGGMTVMLAIVVALALAMVSQKGADSSATPVSASTRPAVMEADKEGVQAALEWAKLLDSQRWGESWKASGTLLRSQVSEAAWMSTVRPLRLQLGAVSSRKVVMVSNTRSLPGAPDGDYKIILFETDFATKKGAAETVVLAREGARWTVNGYFFR